MSAYAIPPSFGSPSVIAAVPARALHPPVVQIASGPGLLSHARKRRGSWTAGDRRSLHPKLSDPPPRTYATCAHHSRFLLCVSFLRRGHANLLCIVPTYCDDLRRVSTDRWRGVDQGRLGVESAVMREIAFTAARWWGDSARSRTPQCGGGRSHVVARLRGQVEVLGTERHCRVEFRNVGRCGDADDDVHRAAVGCRPCVARRCGASPHL